MDVNYEDIYKKIWQLSPQVTNRAVYTELVSLTRNLIKVYDQQGRLDADPFEPTRERNLDLPEALNPLLQNSTCLITGGLGCVGTALINALHKFNIARIIILDKKAATSPPISDKVIVVQGDIRNEQIVNKVFQKYQPQFVFHTAAQRDPGYAESHICETVTTNVLGTLNIVTACEETESVQQCVFSSTGKSSRYFTEEVYAATKKICEYIMDTYAAKSRVKYSMARFTHILDNSLMNEQLKSEARTKDFLAVHSPGKYVTAQNVKEAACLMLNGLISSEQGQCNFLLVRHLAWPVESLEMALYYIKQAGSNIPVIFIGNPIGYSEKFFRGQLDWSNPEELNLLINVYEHRYRKYTQEGDMIVSHICPTDGKTLQKVLWSIEEASGESETKEVLISGLKQIVRESLKMVDKNETINILNWGLQPKFLNAERAKISDYGYTINLLFESLEGTESFKTVQNLFYQNAQ